MMNSPESMNQLTKISQKRQKGKARLGYIKQGESSQQGSQNNKRPTRNHCGKIGHTSNKCWRNGKYKFNGKCYNCNKHGHREIECKEKSKFEDKCVNCNKQGHKSSECKIKDRNPIEQIVKAIFGWDYNT